MLDFDTIRFAVQTRIEFFEEARDHARLLYGQTDDSYFHGKMNAYNLAAENIEGLLWHISTLEEEYVRATQSED